MIFFDTKIKQPVCVLIGVLFILLLTPIPTFGIGIKVWPGGMTIQNLPLGEVYDLDKEKGVRLKITNEDDRAHTYSISAYQPSSIGSEGAIGYLDIPNTEWFYFEKPEIKIEANSEAETKIYLKVPKEDKYYNQHWVVSVGVEAKPELSETFVLAIYPRFQIETQSKEDLAEKPYGSIAFLPSTVIFDDVRSGVIKKAKIKIYNNDIVQHAYKIEPLDRSSEAAKRWISLSSGYTWIPESNWITADKTEVTIPAQKNYELILHVNIPKDKENYNRKWEEILTVTPDEGKNGFFRVQINTAEDNGQKTF